MLIYQYTPCFNMVYTSFLPSTAAPGLLQEISDALGLRHGWPIPLEALALVDMGR